MTLWFSDAPFSPKELDAFHESSATPDKTPDGKSRTLIYFAFCPGAGQPAARAAAVKSVETDINVAGSVFLGRQWVFDLPKDKEVTRVPPSSVRRQGFAGSGLIRAWYAAACSGLPHSV